jgi:hypothetical protein
MTFSPELYIIGDGNDRWMEIKTALLLEANSEVAKILLDR